MHMTCLALCLSQTYKAVKMLITNSIIHYGSDDGGDGGCVDGWQW